MNKPEFMKNITLSYPNLEDLNCGEENVIYKMAIDVAESFDDAIVGKIIDIAKEKGANNLFLLNKKDILSALEKQIPKKPIEDISKDYEGNIIDDVFFCPKCTRTICFGSENNLAENYPYCNCGQALDWSDTNDR